MDADAFPASRTVGLALLIHPVWTSRTLLATVGPALPLISSCCRQLEVWNAIHTLNTLHPRTAGRSKPPLFSTPLLTPLLACSEDYTDAGVH